MAAAVEVEGMLKLLEQVLQLQWLLDQHLFITTSLLLPQEKLLFG
jgi:hypothetical protein